jgi:hypothetical protein
MSPLRTAAIQYVSDNKTLGLQLAQRDIPGRKYDSQGRRLFDKFEMIVGDEDGDDVDDGFIEVEVGKLIDARLLKAVEGGEEGGGKEDVVMKEELVGEVGGAL